VTTIKLRNPKQLGPAVRTLAKQFDNGVITALRKTARYGATQAVRMSATSKPYRPRATGTYERSFTVIKVPDGAILTNMARHSIFVEVGRRPGKRPPLKPIIEWVRIKRLAKGSKAVRVALAIQRKIGRKGTKGRYVLRRTMPLLAKRLPLEISLAMQKAVDRAARRSNG
jgi:hypothetical protein